ncbi:MAG: NAD(P)H-hydrate epimerase [Planctomycetaceae bacterium]|nr:NAD(P)H-hydrate epimerase [Planctomycetaceae bacterium]
MKEWNGQNTADFQVFDRVQAKAFDQWAIRQMQIPGVVLMENAAGNISQAVLSYFRQPAEKGVCVFCGGGNNGGDGFAIARHLRNHRIEVRIAVCGDPNRLKGEAETNFIICQKMGLPMTTVDLGSADLFKQVKNVIGASGLLVDAVLGTGFESELKNPQAMLISCMNAHNLPVVAVDIPSGMDCDTGVPLPVCVEAAATVTLAALKKGFVESPESRNVTGRVFVADIGIVK